MCEVCVLCFSEVPPGDFSPCFFLFFLNDPRGDVIVFRKKTFPRAPPSRGEFRGYYGIYMVITYSKGNDQPGRAVNPARDQLIL